MIEWSAIFKILPIFVLAMISPGPDFMIVSTISLTRGRADGVKAAAGIATIISLYTLVCLTGLSALFGHYLYVTMAIKACGGLYLVYLGYRLWRGSFVKQEAAEAPVAGSGRRRSAYLAGVVTCLSNPKAVVFFASVFALALTPDTNLATQAALAVGSPGLAFLWFSLVAVGLSRGKVRARYQRWQKVIDRVTGTLLGFFGLKLILSAGE